MLIDTHCHLQDAEAFGDPAREVAEAQASGVELIVVVGVRPSDWEAAVALAERFEPVHAILGWHPNYTADYDPSTLADLETRLGHPKVCALGEIGLDYHWDYAPREQQARALRDQLELARRMDVPVVFHARKAYGDLLDLLEGAPPHRYLFHCFSGSEEDARRAVALDAYFGVDGPVTYKGAAELREVLNMLPRERLVLETDSPYMTPAPFRGKPNRPAYLPYINRALSALLELSEEACGGLTTANARRFFGL